VIGPDPVVLPHHDPRYANQGYLTPAPDGIDAAFAWALPGGDGDGQQVVDVERGWTHDHDEDLIDHGATLIHGTVRSKSRYHGTAVLGEIASVGNSIGCIGITPKVDRIMCSSLFVSTVADAILAATGALSCGDVILLEIQTVAKYTSNGSPTYGPIETGNLNLEAIRLASRSA